MFTGNLYKIPFSEQEVHNYRSFYQPVNPEDELFS